MGDTLETVAAAEMRSNFKLLVHAGAPTSHADDERYIAQARAYQALPEAAYSRIALSTDAASPHRSAHDQNVFDVRESSGGQRQRPIPVFLDDTQLAIGALDSQWLNAAALAPHGLRRAPANSTHPNTARQEDGQLTVTTTHRPDEDLTLQKHAEASSRREEVISATERAYSDQRSCQDHNDVTEGNSQLPSSYSLTDSEVSRARPASPQRSLSALDPVSATPEVLPEAAPPLLRAHSSPANVTTAATTDEPHTSVFRSRSIRPQNPPTALAKYTSHVTPALRLLEQDESVTVCYKPLSVTRQIDSLERGHWLVQCGGWPRNVEEEFWSTLETVVGNGSAGWGVWCSQESHDVISSQPPENPVGSPQFLPPLRVYCWGEVVKHVYLLLYVASNSKVRRLGLQWIDADGEVVVQMRSA